jgi:predicted RNase H-like nuclease (RuvC/YqgF family)
LIPPSTAIAQVSPSTTLTASFVSETLKPLLLEAETQSSALEATLSDLEIRLAASEAQRKLDAEARQKEIDSLQTQLGTLGERVTTLQNYSDVLWMLLTDFSGSEQDKQQAAIQAINDIKRQVQTEETKSKLLGGGLIATSIVAITVTVFAFLKK